MCSLESQFWLSIVDKDKNELLGLNEDIFIPENMDCQLLRFIRRGCLKCFAICHIVRTNLLKSSEDIFIPELN